MARIEQRVDELVFRAKTEGVDTAKRAIDGLAASHGKAGAAADANGRVHEALGRAMRNPTAAFDELQRKLQGSPAAWRALEQGLRVVGRAADAGKSDIDALRVATDDLLRNFQRAVAPKLSVDFDIAPLRAAVGQAKSFDDQMRGTLRAMLKDAEAAEQAMREQAKATDDLAARTLKFREALEPLAVAQRKLNAELAEAKALRSAGAISENEELRRSQQLNDEYARTARSMGVANDNVRLTSGQVQNLGYQLNDAATMLLSGASPFQVIATQGGQVLQILQENGGVLASLRAIGTTALEAAAKGTTALASMVAAGQAAAAAGAAASASFSFTGIASGVAGIVSKINPAVAAITAVAAASAYLWYNSRDAAGDAQKSVESYRKAVDAIRVSYKDLGEAIDSAYARQMRGSATLATAQTQASLVVQKAALRSGVESLTDIPGIGPGKGLVDGAKNLWNYGDEGIAKIRELYGELLRGERTVADTQEAIARIRLDPKVSDETKKLADAFITASEGARTAEAQITSLEEAARELSSIRFDAFSKQLDDFIPNAKSARDRINEIADAAGQQAVTRGQAYEIERKRAAGLAELDRQEANRRSGYELDVRLITARTAAEKAGIAAERVRLDLASDPTLTDAQRNLQIEEARTLSLAQSQHELVEAQRQRVEAGQAQVEQLEFEQTLVGRNAAETAQLRAQYDMLTAAKKAARDAGTVVDPTEEAAIRAQAAEIGRLTAETEKLNFQRDLQFRLDQAGRNPAERQIAQDVRSYGEDIASANGQAMAAQLRYVASVEKTSEQLREMREVGKDAFLDIVDALGSGENAVDSLIGAFANLGKQLASLGAQKLFDGLFGDGSKQAANGAAGIAGSLAKGLTGAVPSTDQTYSAPLGKVDRAPLPPLVTGEGFSASKASTVAAQSVPARVWNFFAGKGLSPHQIAGIMGNVKAESAFNPGAVGDGGNAFGLFQWNDRGPAMQRFVGADWRSNVNGQLEFAWKELQTSESRAYRALLNAKDVTQATEAFLGFERPHGYNTGVRNSHNYSGRLADANAAHSQYGGQNVAYSTNDNRALAKGVSEGVVDANRRLGSSADPWSGMRTAGGLGGDAAAVAPSSGGLKGMLSNLFGGNGLQMLGAGIGGFSSGYQSGSPIGGGLQGALGGFAAGGPIGAVIGGLAGLAGGIFGGKAQRKAQHQAAAAEWEKVRPQYEQFDRSLSGEGTGDLRSMITGLWGQLDAFMAKGGAAWKYGKGNSTAQFAATGTKMFAKWQEAKDDFLEAFPEMIEDLTSGAGLEGEFVKGRAKVRGLRDSIRNFVDDVKIAFMDADIGIPTSPEYEAEAKQWEEKRNAAVAEAKKAAGEYALTMLYLKDNTSSVQKAIDSFNGTAAGLKNVLIELGWTSEQAASDIQDKLTAALTDMRKSFEQDILDQIADLKGEGYFAEVRTFLSDFETIKSDAKLLGADTSNLDELFGLKLQSIVDGAELTGDAFDALIKAFPQLSGVVTAFVETTEDVVATTKQVQDAYQSFLEGRLSEAISARAEAESNLRSEYERTTQRIGSIREFLRNMALDTSTSTLSGKDRVLEAQRVYRETLFKANGGDADAQDALLDVSRDYLDAARSYYATSADYGEIYKEIETTLKASASRMETELDVAKRQASFLGEIAASTKGLSGLMKEYLDAAKLVTDTQKLVDGNRTFGLNPTRNRSIDAAIKQVGLNYSGNYGIVNGADPFLQWRSALPAEQRAIVEGIINQYIGMNYDVGGYTGAGHRKQPAGIVHKGEVVFNQDDVSAWGGPLQVERLRKGLVPDPYPQTISEQTATASAPQFASREEVRELGRKLDRIADILGSGFEGQIDATDRLGFATEQAAAASRRAASRSVKAA